MSAKHTPTPWEYAGPESERIASLVEQYDIYASSGEEAGPIAQVSGLDDTRFIVLACNAHQGLVDALSVMQEEFISQARNTHFSLGHSGDMEKCGSFICLTAQDILKKSCGVLLKVNQ